MFIMSDILLSKKFLKTLWIYVTALHRKSQVNFHKFRNVFYCFFVKTNKLFFLLFRVPYFLVKYYNILYNICSFSKHFWGEK